MESTTRLVRKVGSPIRKVPSHACRILLAAALQFAAIASGFAQLPLLSWSPTIGVPGVDGGVNAIVEWDPDGNGPLPPRIVAGGSFVTIGGIPASNIAQWNGTVWAPVGMGFPGASVYALAVMSNGNLVAGTDLGVTCWNGATWGPLGSNGPTGAIFAATVAPIGDLIVGGYGSELVMRWDGVSWSSMAANLSASFWGSGAYVFSLAIMPSGEIVAGGDFLVSNPTGGVCCPSIAVWGSAGGWGPMGAGFFWAPFYTSGVTALKVMPNGDLIACGQFTASGGIPLNGIARWSGGTWNPLPSRLSPVLTPAALTTLPNGDLVMGQFDRNYYGTPSSPLVFGFNGSSWYPIGVGGRAVRALCTTSSGMLAVGGGEFGDPGANVALATFNFGATTVPVGAGCGGAGLPTLGLTAPRIGTVANFSLTGGTPNAYGSVLVSTVPALPTVIGGGCVVQLDLGTLIEFAAFSADSNGSWDMNLALPYDPNLVGISFAVQAVLFPTAGPLGIDLTNGVTATIGY